NNVGGIVPPEFRGIHHAVCVGTERHPGTSIAEYPPTRCKAINTTELEGKSEEHYRQKGKQGK
ncbi:MAG: hypothetical protein AAEJ57_00430, partial [Opitutales bacterium]